MPQQARVAPGAVVELSASQWACGDGPLVLKIERDRPDLSRYYEDQLWLEGWRLDDAGVAVEWVQSLVPIAVLLHKLDGPPR